MATSCCSRAALMSRLCAVIAMPPKQLLWSLIFRSAPNLIGLLLKKFLKKEPQQMELETAVSTMPWLPEDILMDIFATLGAPDLVRAGCVCSSWRAASMFLRNLENYRLSQTPCLFYTSESAGDDVGFLYSLMEKRSYKFTLPQPPIRSRFLVGCSNGFLITADDMSELHLVNPITGEQIALPPVATMEHVKPIFGVSGTIHEYELSYDVGEGYRGLFETYSPNELNECLYFRAYLFTDPSTESYIVVLIHAPFFLLSFAQPGDAKWTLLPHGRGYRDCTYKDGLLYALRKDGEIVAFDLTASPVTMAVVLDGLKRSICDSMYIIHAPWGDLLQVWRAVVEPPNAPRFDHRISHSRTAKIEVYKVDLETKELVEINRLPHHILFLGHNHSLCLIAEGHPELKSNHAYFTDDHYSLTVQYPDGTRDLGAIDLENSVKMEIVSEIWSNWPCPTWITPNLTKLNLAFNR